MIHAPLLLVLLSGAPDGGPMHDCPMHAAHAALDARGAQAMGFSQERTRHHFKRTVRGGEISVEAAPEDAQSRDAIRAHLTHIASAFADGDFSLPMFIHDPPPPGVETMKALRKEIRYRYEATPRGARVLIDTGNAKALEAVHAFLKLQIEDHRTGDSLEVQR